MCLNLSSKKHYSLKTKEKPFAKQNKILSLNKEQSYCSKFPKHEQGLILVEMKIERYTLKQLSVEQEVLVWEKPTETLCGSTSLVTSGDVTRAIWGWRIPVDNANKFGGVELQRSELTRPL